MNTPVDAPRTESPPTLLVIEPDASDPLDRFGDWLADAGIAVRVVRPYAGDPVPHVLGETGLIVLGGEMSANDDADHPWLQDIRILLRDAVGSERPTLAICLGAQLLSRALGGAVTPGTQGVEAGVIDVRLREEAAQDALFNGHDESFPMGSMHGDAISTLPSGAIWLAESESYPHQAYRVGTCAWGVQFHPEISPLTYQGWAVTFRSRDPEDVVRVERGRVDFPRRDDQVIAPARLLADRFAALVRAADESSGAMT